MTLPTHPNTVGTVVYERTVRVREYESAKASVYIQFEMPDPTVHNGSYGTEVLSRISDAFFQAKSAVYDELGLEFSVDAGGTIREAINATFGQVTEVHARPDRPTPITTTAAPAPAAVAAAPAAAPAPAGGDRPPYDPSTSDKQEKAANARWAKDRLVSHPDEFWSNAQAKAEGRFKPTAPDFKHKDTGIGVWNS